MNYTLLALLIAAGILLAYLLFPDKIYPTSSCSEFLKAGRWLRDQNLDHVSQEIRAQLCKVPMYMIAQPEMCPSYEWRDLYNEMRCDSSAESSGTLGSDGVSLRLS